MCQGGCVKFPGEHSAEDRAAEENGSTVVLDDWTLLPPGTVTSHLSQDPCAQTGQKSRKPLPSIDYAGWILSSCNDQW